MEEIFSYPASVIEKYKEQLLLSRLDLEVTIQTAPRDSEILKNQANAKMAEAKAEKDPNVGSALASKANSLLRESLEVTSKIEKAKAGIEKIDNILSGLNR